MKKILMPSGQYVLIDDEDFNLVNKYTWRLSGKGDYKYACTGYVLSKKRRKRGCKSHKPFLYMHRLIMSPRKNMLVDHINGNRLDNRKINLRVCTHKQNMQNRKPELKRKYKGVYYNKEEKNYSARINRVNLGRYRTEIEAAIAHDIGAIKFHGEFAKLNFPKKKMKS